MPRYRDKEPPYLLDIMEQKFVKPILKESNNQYKTGERYTVNIKGGAEYKEHTYNPNNPYNPYEFHYVFFGENGEKFFWNTTKENTAMNKGYISFKSPSKIRLTILKINGSNYLVNRVSKV